MKDILEISGYIVGAVILIIAIYGVFDFIIKVWGDK